MRVNYNDIDTVRIININNVAAVDDDEDEDDNDNFLFFITHTYTLMYCKTVAAV